MTFKDQAALDLGVFFNTDEHADEGLYNGQPVQVVADTESVQSSSIPGVIAPALAAFLRADQVPVCKAGDKVVIDGATYYVGASPMLESGVWSVTLEGEVKNLRVGV